MCLNSCVIKSIQIETQIVANCLGRDPIFSVAENMKLVENSSTPVLALDRSLRACPRWGLKFSINCASTYFVVQLFTIVHLQKFVNDMICLLAVAPFPG